ncbi:MAG: DUF5688 family protein [Eubacteriales bacterium]|nr:DUF5688 family protein [Eubacteriales bacterium]
MDFVEFCEEIRDRLFIKVSSFEKIKEKLEEIPYTRIENLAISYHILLEKCADKVTSIVVSKALFEKMGIDKEEFHKEALENSSRLFPVYVDNIKNIIFRISDKDKICDDTLEIREMISKSMKKENEYPLFVVTNKIYTYGAATIFYDGVMEQIGESFGKNYFILPSSVHEMIILPDDGKFEYKKLKEIVESVNREIVSPDDFLTDDVYYYNIEKHLFEIVG